MCGNQSSCAGSSTAPYCDSEHSVCKCSENQDACITAGETCRSGKCHCGNGESCDKNETAPYCDFENNLCKCSDQIDACDADSENCIDGHCKRISKLKRILTFPEYILTDNANLIF